MENDVIELRRLEEDLLRVAEPWFDDPETSRWLGARDWIRRELDFTRTMPRRYAWIAFEEDVPVGFIDAEVGPLSGAPTTPPVEGTDHAGMTIVVDPVLRGRKYAGRMIDAMVELPELAPANTLWAGVDPENERSLRAFASAGFARTQVTDRFGSIYLSRARSAGRRDDRSPPIAT